MNKKIPVPEFDNKIEWFDEVLPVEVGPAVDWALAKGYSKEEILIAAQRDIPQHLEKVRDYLTKDNA